MQLDEKSFLASFARKHQITIELEKLSPDERATLERAVENSRDRRRCKEDATHADAELLRLLQGFSLRSTLAELNVTSKNINPTTIITEHIAHIMHAVERYRRAKHNEPCNGIEARDGIIEAVIFVNNHY